MIKVKELNNIEEIKEFLKNNIEIEQAIFYYEEKVIDKTQTKITEFIK